jgi:hypothetical protein
MSRTHRGVRLSSEHCSKISAGLHGRKHTEEAKKNMSGVRKNGRYVHPLGYVSLFCPTHPFANSQGHVMEHRLIMEEAIGRILSPQEAVHHINGIANDNRRENLMLFSSRGKHLQYHMHNEIKERP